MISSGGYEPVMFCEPGSILDTVLLSLHALLQLHIWSKSCNGSVVDLCVRKRVLPGATTDHGQQDDAVLLRTMPTPTAEVGTSNMSSCRVWRSFLVTSSHDTACLKRFKLRSTHS